VLAVLALLAISFFVVISWNDGPPTGPAEVTTKPRTAPVAIPIPLDLMAKVNGQIYHVQADTGYVLAIVQEDKSFVPLDSAFVAPVFSRVEE